MSLKNKGLPVGSVLLETVRHDVENRRSFFFSDPEEVLSAYSTNQVPELLEALDERLANGFFVAGYLDYECGYAFESVFEEFERDDRPLAWFGVYKGPNSRDPSVEPRFRDVAAESLRFSLDVDGYEDTFGRIRGYLKEGDVYQINYTGRLDFEAAISADELYAALRKRQPVGYNALIKTADTAVLSCSPELFFRRSGSRIWTRPMKGTIRRGRYAAEDLELAHRLREDEKSRAENVMIVDLLRNDLSRLAEPGSVTVPALFETERYETVIQLTSTVRAELPEQATLSEIFSRLFPCGSVTGAPKIRAMQLIRELESSPRGVYTGAIGYCAPDGEAVFSVAIRTVELRDGRGQLGVGGGIVWDSKARDEYEESLLKARFLTDAPWRPTLFETMLWRDGYPLLDRHLDRMQSSAAYLGYRFDRLANAERLNTAARDFELGTVHRVRLSLKPDGSVDITHRPLGRPSLVPGTVRISSVRTDPQWRWLYHKSTDRRLYELAYARARDVGDVEMLFLNTSEEVTEGSRSNIFVRKGDRLLTPPISCGLLPGTRRAEILATNPGAEERVVTKDDLQSADEVLLCNATNELTPVDLVTEELVLEEFDQVHSHP